MWLKCITCEALARPVYQCAAVSKHIIDVELVQKGLHNQPVNLREHLQAIIDAADLKNYDAVLFSYGLCGQATSDLVARQKPLVIPKAHDCITLFLGSRGRYQDQFTNFPGTYWFAQDYIERDDGTGSAMSMGSTTDNDLNSQYQEYVDKYGKDNADYLMGVMGAWQEHYKRAAYIDLGIANGDMVEKKAQELAARRNWNFEKLTGDIVLIRKLLEGDWDDDYLVVQPGQRTQMTYDENVIGCLLDTAKGKNDGKR